MWLLLAAGTEGRKQVFFPNLDPTGRALPEESAVKSKYIGLRLGMAFAVLIAMLVGIGQSGLRRMKEIEENLGDITGRNSTNYN